MRITVKNYEKARKTVERAHEQMKLVEAWDEAVKKLGDLGNQRLVAITIGDDGSVRTECELTGTALPPNRTGDQDS